MLFAGLLLFAVLLHEIGLRIVFENVRLAGWGIGLIVVQELLAYGCNTLGWRCAFPVPRPAIDFGHLMAARMAGDAINYVTPTATLGGEFVRVRLLRGRASATEVVASVAIAKLSQTVAQIAFIVLGLLVVLRETPLPPLLRQSVFVSVSIMVAIAVPLLMAQRRGLSVPLVRSLHALGLPQYASRLGGRLKPLDDEIVAFHASQGWGFVCSASWFFAGWTLGLLEVWLGLFLLDVPITLERVVAIEILSTTIDAMLFFVPGKVGTQEGGKVLIFSLLGLDPGKGLSFAILRRIRELVWAGVGLVILARVQVELRPAAAAVQVGS